MKKTFINRVKSSKENDADKIGGFNLNIDQSVQEICEAYNTSSGATRNVIYVLMLLSVVALIGVLNTTDWNWTKKRIELISRTLEQDEAQQNTHVKDHIFSQLKKNDDYMLRRAKGLKNNTSAATLEGLTTRYRHDSIQSELHFLSEKLQDSISLNIDLEQKKSLLAVKIINSDRISIPLMGNSFDINDIALISGLSFIILLIMLRFTLAREKDNLKIAFNVISERYVEDRLKDDYLEKIRKYLPDDMPLTEFKNVINFKRRRYHYNSLSMNEIFNLPKLDISRDMLQKTWGGRLVMNHLFFFPYLAYFIIVCNDINTIKNGFILSWNITTVSMSLSVLCLILISYLCHDCNKQKQIINIFFNDFYRRDYQVKRAKYIRYSERFTPWQEWPVLDCIFYCFGFLIFLFSRYLIDPLLYLYHLLRKKLHSLAAVKKPLNS